MTVSSSVAYKAYSGNGVTTAFSTTFQFFDNTDLSVVLVDDATMVETTQTLTTHYTVSGGSGSTGTVTMLTAPASGKTLVLRRVIPYTQATDYISNDAFPADAHELALDKLTMLVQQVYGLMLSTPTMPVDFDPNTDTRPTLPMPEEGKVLIGNADEDGWENAEVADLGLADIPVTITAAAAGDLLMYNGTAWIDATTLTGNYTVSGSLAVPTVTANDNDTSAASTAFVQQARANALSVADAAGAPTAAHRQVLYTSLSAARTVTLPLAADVRAGSMIEIVDGSGSASQTNAISVARAGSDTIAGSATTQVCINVPRGSAVLMSDGVSAWHFVKLSVIYVHIATADVALANAGTYYTGATVSQGTLGTWEITSGISVVATDGGQRFNIKLTDGTTTIASQYISTHGANAREGSYLSGRISAPAGNLVIQANSPSTTNASIEYNASGLSADTFIKAVRVA